MSITEKEELKSDSNLVDRNGDVLVYLYSSSETKGGFRGRIVFQYGPARVASNPIKRQNKDQLLKDLTKQYTEFAIKHKDQLNNIHYIREVILD